MPRLVEVRVPDMGSFKDVAIIDVLVKPGDRVVLDSPLITLETEKATMDVPSTVAGTLAQLHVAKGGKVSPGDLVATVDAEGELPSAAASAAAPSTSSPSASPGGPPMPPPAAAPTLAAAEPLPGAIPGGRTDLAPIDEPGFSRAHAGPSVRRLARELGVDLARVKGSGIKGRITAEDVKSWVKQAIQGTASLAVGGSGGVALPRVPIVDHAAFGPIEVRPLNRIQRISGPRLHASWVNLPHVTQFDEADITELEELRATLKDRAARQGIKLTPLAFIVRAVVRALAEFPAFNASLDESGQNLVLKRYCHVGFAADTPNGLLVPVIRDADRKDIYEIARSLAELSEKAREGRLSGNEMQGGCFTISSLGGIGGTAFTPIINAPEVAILGVSRSSMKPVWRNGQFMPRLMLPLSLSYDHRVIDGAAAVRFTSFLAARLADARGLVEAVP